jgi:hypothetical protein
MCDREPSAIITVAGSERKLYQDGQIFLQNGENFEIRFFNPLTEKIGVSITFNGVQKNDGLLILNPGQDITLDRFLGEKKKMVYETYTIDGNNQTAVEATKLNGLVEFKFYKEQSYNYGRTMCYCDNTILNSNIGGTGIVYGGTSISTNYCDSSSSKIRGSKLSKSIETGRIEKGENSSQEIKSVNAQFETYPFHTINYYLKPNSLKPQTITEIKQYCTHCGYRLRKNTWLYCPKCSEKI